MVNTGCKSGERLVFGTQIGYVDKPAAMARHTALEPAYCFKLIERLESYPVQVAASSGAEVSFFFEQFPVTAQCFPEKESQSEMHQPERTFRRALTVALEHVVIDLLLCQFRR